MKSYFPTGRAAWQRWTWILPVVFLLAGMLALLQSTPAYALPKDDDEGLPRPICQADRYVQARLYISDGVHSGLDIVRTRTVTITAQTAKIIFLAGDCSIELHPIPANEFSWQLATKPKTSTDAGFSTSGFNAALTADVAGTYRVTFKACLGGCLIDGFPIDEVTSEITLNAKDFLALPPGTEPVIPTMTATEPSNIPEAEINEKCLGGGGVVDPQWVTVDDWGGPQDYKLLEGNIHKSRISRKDNPLNHESQDFLFHVEPDPAYRHLLNGERKYVEVEWERSHYPEAFRPTAGDRVSVVGYWILDCGHGGPTEIHPPVMVATQRARPVLISSAQKFLLPNPSDDIPPSVEESIGTGVYAPGIVTDLFVNANSGEVTDNCSATGLHQPGTIVQTPQGPLFITGDCIRGPSNIKRIYTFKIYLTEQPELIGGREVPLYIEVKNHPAGFTSGPAPQITRINDPDNPYLQVTLDLRNFTGKQYARRIYAAWVLPSPENWNLQAWQVRLNSMNVHDDGDCNICGRGDGDLRFWINVNNAENEWTKLFDCDGCVHGTETFGGRPWQTGTTANTTPDRLLGPDVLLFPQQRIWVHTSGFEDDWTVSDDTGSVSALLQQQARAYNARSTCTEQTVSGCAAYTLNFEVLAGTPLPAPQLTEAAQDLFDGYVIKPAANGPAVECLNCAGQQKVWYPYDDSYASDQEPTDLSETVHFRVQPSLEYSVTTDITLGDFAGVLDKTLAISPTRVYSFMQELRGEVDQVLFPKGLQAAGADQSDAAVKEKVEEVKGNLVLWRSAFPDDLWEETFGDLEPLAAAIVVTETASSASVVAPGAQVSFTVEIGNIGDRAVTITHQIDSLYGDITDPANAALVKTTCNTSQLLAQGALSTCAFTAVAGGVAGDVLTSTVTVSATNEYSRALSAEDSVQIAVVAEPPGTLVIVNKVVGTAPSSSWSYDGPSGSFTLPAVGGSQTFAGLPAGQYAISQTVKSGYTVAAICSDGSNGTDNITVNLASAAQVTCTFTNTESAEPAATLVIVNKVVGTAPSSSWSHDGPSGPFTLPAAGGSQTFGGLPAGQYAISQTAQSGYTVAVACSDGSTGTDNVTVNLASAAQVTCTFTNTQDEPVEQNKLYLPETRKK